MGKRNWKKWLAVLLCMAMCMGNAGVSRVYAAVTDGETGEELEETPEQEEEKEPEEEEPETPKEEEKEPSEEEKPETPKDDAEKKPGEENPGTTGEEKPGTSGEEKPEIPKDDEGEKPEMPGENIPGTPEEEETETDGEISDESDENLSEDTILSINEEMVDDEVSEMALETSGTFGDNLAWELTADGVLTISGTGNMPYVSANELPWYKDRALIKKVIIQEGVTTIGDEAFSNCSNLTSVKIPTSVTSIRTGAFSNCSSLTDITIPNGVTRMGDSLFFGCSDLVSIVIPDSVIEIGAYAFRNCINLSNIMIPSGVSVINPGIFAGCSSLISITIPDGVITIGTWAFRDCESLSSITLPDSIINIEDQAFMSCSSLTNITIPNGVTIIGKEMFRSCSSLTSITIPNSVTTIGNSAFRDCSSLTSITIPNGVISIGELAFCACYNLTIITIPASVTSIGEEAFYNCRSLISITIPNGVATIGNSTFMYCSSLTSITIPDSVTSIENYAFSNCGSLTSITVPDSVTSIGACAFLECVSLASITLPNSVTSIGHGAFDGCDKLSDVYYSGSKSDWEAIQIEEENEELINATIVFNSSGMGSAGGDESGDQPVKPPVTQDDPTLIVHGRTFEFTDPGSITLNWGWNYILNRDSSDYINDVAAVALTLSAATERSQNAIESMLASDNFGADLIKSVNYNESLSNIYKPACTFAHKTIDNGGKTEHIIIIVGRGTSSFSDGVTDYCSITDNFRITANNIWLSFAEWLNNEEIDGEKLTCAIGNGNVKFFVTGHSLGGAVANRIAYRLNQVYGSENIYAYTFASPPTEGQSSTVAPNIFNLLCKGDPVPYLGAFTDGRYGTELWFADSCSIPSGFPYFGFFDNHVVESYMKHLLNISNYRFRTAVKSGGVRCPVDLRIYNSSGQLMGSVTNNVVDKENITDSVMIVLSGENNDEKNFYFLTDDTYTIELTGTDDGTLTYAVRDTYVDKNTVVEKRYANVNLYAGKRMTSTVSAWDIGDTSVDTSGLVSTPDTRLLVVDNSGSPVKEVLADGNGTEIPIKDDDDPGNKPGTDPGNKPGDKPSSKPNGGSSNGGGGGASDSKASASTLYDRNASGKTVVEAWKPQTPDEKKRYACMGTETVQYTLEKDNAYRIVIENAMQGPLCFASFESALDGYTIGRTYNIYTLPNNVYSREQEVQFTLTIPEAVYKKGRTYKMICVTKNGVPVIYDDLDDNPRTITVRTNKFYAYALIYK